MKVAFVGLSHLGLTSGISLASKGFEIVGYDADKALIERLNQKNLPIHEPQLDALLAEHSGKITFTSDASALAKCDVVYFSLDIKTDDNNVSDLAPIRTLIDREVGNIAKDAAVVLLSQVPPGFSRGVSEKIGADRFFYQVETLIFGQAVQRALQPERYIVGSAHPEKALHPAYAKVLAACNCPVLNMRYESAELSKIAINLFLVSSVSTTNTLAEVCEGIGADWKEIAPALKLDRRIGPYAYLSPGLGIAGGNLERDLMTVCALGEKHNADSGVVQSWIKNSKYRAQWAFRTYQSALKPGSAAPKIALWGLAYKQDTKSTKNSPSIAFVEAIRGEATINAYDPQVELGVHKFKNLTQVKTPIDACKGADILMVLTPWKEFSTQDLQKAKAEMAGKIIVDPYNILDEATCKKLGFTYYRLGAKA